MTIFLVLFLISVPIFYIYGLVMFTRSLAQKKARPLEQLAQDIRQALYGDLPVNERRQLEAILQTLQPDAPLSSSVGVLKSTASEISSVPQSRQEDGAVGNEQNVAPMISSPPVATDHSTVLLYLGAFLLLISASIFVGFNYQAFSGTAKTLLIALAAAISYFLGLGLYQRTERFKSAGVTFTSLGLVLIPLVGLAAHSYIFLGTQPRLVWFLTSVAMVGGYMLALKVVRTTLLHYLSLCTVISLWCSVWSLFSVPVYYFGWALVLLAGVFQWYQESRHPEKSLGSALTITSALMVPAAVFLSLVLVSEYGWWQFSIQTALAAGYYILVGYWRTQLATQHWISQLVIGLVTVSILSMIRALLGSFTEIKFGLSVLAMSAVYLGLVEGALWGQRSQAISQGVRQWLVEVSNSLAFATVLLATAGVFWYTDDSKKLALSVGYFIVVSGWLAIRKKQPLFFVLSVMGILCQPIILGWMWLGEYVLVWQSWIYIGLASLFILGQWWVQQLQSKMKLAPEWPYIFWVAQSISLILAVALILCTPFWGWRLAVTTTVALLLLLLSRMTRREMYVFGSWLLSLYIGYAFNQTLGLAASWLPVWGMTLGVIWYIAGEFAQDSLRRLCRMAGLLTLYLAAGSKLWIMPSNWTALASLVVAGLMTMVDGGRQSKRSQLYMGAAVLMGAFEWYLFEYAHLKEVLWYSWLWAGYCAVLAILTHLRVATEKTSEAIAARQSEVDSFIVLSLLALTVPLALQALESQTKAVWLLGIDLGLIALGMSIKKALIWRWGVVLLVIQVLYSLRDFIIGLPTWVVFGGIGLGLVVAAVILLSKQRQQTK